MNTKQKRKLIGVTCLIVILSIAAGLILYALKQNINLFYTPTQLLEATTQPNQHIRIGGYVKKNSVRYNAAGTGVTFMITDRVNELPIEYNGVLPNLFREGQGVVVTGQINNAHIFIANEVLAKHDEKYMPSALKNLKKGDGYGT